MGLLMTRLAAEANLWAEPDALWLRYVGVQPDLSLARRRDWERLSELTTFGKEFAIYVEQLIESELAESIGTDVRVNYLDLDKIDLDYDFFKQLAPISPFYLIVEGEGALGTPDFRYRYRYHLGSAKVYPRRFGCFLYYTGKIFRMDQRLFRLVTILEEFNQRHRENIDPATLKAESLKTHHEIQTIAEEVGARLDNYLRQEEVICPDKVHLGVTADTQGRITFYPIFPATSEADSLQAFLTSGSVPAVYDIVKPDGRRSRVIVDEPIKEILDKMLRVRRVSGRTKAQALGDPLSVLEGADLEVLDLEGYGPRVRAIGDYPKDVRAYVRRQSLGFLDPPSETGLEVLYPDGSQRDLKFTSLEETETLLDKLEGALRVGEPTVPWLGTELPITPELIQSVREAVDVNKQTGKVPEAETTDRPEPKGHSYLIIYTNEPEKEFEDPPIEFQAPRDFTLPRMAPGINFHKHQREGVDWLVRLFNHPSRRGALLADEMGLGKTLQILTFVAWYFDTQTQPKPALIVTPLILLENETWLKEIRKFFYAEGNIFDPVYTLYGQDLARCRELTATPGRETRLGEPVLRWRELAQCRVIFTNYQTVVNYQFSLGKIEWGLLITDEGQYFKEPKTLVSRALKAMKADFRITLTGTPVENSLLDFWNLMDFLQPGYLDSARKFTQKFIEGTGVEPTETSKLECLRKEVGVNYPQGFVLRRAKEDVLDLPHKHENIIESFLSENQRQAHLTLISQAKDAKGSKKGTQLTLLHELVKLYQHPQLIQNDWADSNWEEAVNVSPKLKSVLETLEKIKDFRDKVIIFARYRQMQAILQNVIESRFKLQVDIINGSDSPRTGRTRYNRQSILEEFQRRPGFQVIILSPHVAGIGLNIVAANHVIHYGRWWNPALEDQATDRVYRIGQEREVHVYFPISQDPRKEFSSFDEKLHSLLLMRKKLRQDFLSPAAEEEALTSELFDNIIEEEVEYRESPSFIKTNSLPQLSPDEFECLVAALLEKMNYQVFLTPLSSDGGLDIVALRNDQLCFLECKHLISRGKISYEAVNQLLDGYEYYLTNVIGGHLKNKNVKLILSTNASFDGKAINLSKEREIDLWSFSDFNTLLTKYPISSI